MNSTVNDSRLTVSVVIPVYNAAPYLPKLLPSLFSQEPVVPQEVILVDSMSEDDTREIASSYNNVRVIPIENFTHGGSRMRGVEAAMSDIVVLMTQDALPRNDRWLANLLRPFADRQVAATFSRQIPYEDASPMERFFLQNRFPPGGPIRRFKRGDETLTLEKVFFSDVSSAIRRELILEHPFDEDLIMSEDQQLARDLLEAGFATVYQPDSVVFHSHNYTLPVVFRRYFDSVYSLTVIFPEHGLRTSASMGFRYLMREMVYMVRHHPGRLPRYALYTLAKTSGTLAGHFARFLPKPILKRMSLHSYHWEHSRP